MCACGCGTCGDKNSLLFESETLGFDWGQVIGPAIQAGIPTAIGLLSGGGGGCLQGRVSGDEAMSNCVPRVMALFDEVESYIGMVPPEAIIQQANAIAAIFSDDRYFDQSIGGRSRQIREAAQAAGRARADAIITLVGGTAPVTGTATQPAAMAPASNAVTIDSKTLLIYGGGLLAAVLILKSL